MGYNRKIKDGTKRMLYIKSGNLCAWCKQTLVYSNSSNLSEICHIEAVNEDGARYNPNLTYEYVNSYENLILLCANCHTFADNKLNENVCSVEMLKRMKCAHEQWVEESLMNKPVVEPPIKWDNYDVSWVCGLYAKYYEKKLDNEYIVKTFNAMYLFNIATRSILYAIVYVCSENREERIDIQRVQQMSGLDVYSFAGILQFLEEQKFIKEEIYVKEDDGYEDENGDFHFVKRDYLFKTVYGTWYIKKKLRILLLIALHFNDYNRFYNFIVNRQIQLLFDNEQ